MPIIHESKDFIVIDKPAGLIVHPAESATDTNSVVSFLLEKYPEVATVGDDPSLRPGIVHRLDRDTSGLLIVARNQKSFEAIKALFQDRKIKKTYIALIFGKFKQEKGIFETYIGRSKKDPRKRISLPAPKKGLKTKKAITKYELTDYFKDAKDNYYSLLKLKIETGRTHQIRSQFFSFNYPIVGDPVYKIKGNPEVKLKRTFLHAKKLAFTLKNEYYQFHSPLSSNLENFLNDLKHVQTISR
ncbi:MAG: RluA family pseudouridine synthase [Candidatus Heimdallarchaeaceae archaeon]